MTAWLRAMWARFRAAIAGDRLDREFDEELDTHRALLVDEGRSRGLSDADARREALRRLGRPLALREIHREQRGIPALDVLSQDLRYALRMLWKSPAFGVVVTVSLALGVGANTALFSLVDDLLLRSLPVPAPERLFEVHQVATGMGAKKAGNSFAPPVFEHIRAHSGVVSEAVGFLALDRPVIVIDGALEPPRQVVLVSSNFFRDLGVTPAVGRVPESSDAAAVILSDGLWRSRFGGSASVLGRAMTIAGRPCTIVGVAPAKFRGLSVERGVDLWIASRAETPQQMMVRLRHGVTSAQAQAEMQALFAALGKQQPDVLNWDEHLAVELLPAGKGLSQLRAQYQRPLLALTGLVTLVFLVTCTNVGNLLLVRNTGRRRELTVRVALGARRSRLVVQYLIESAVLAVAGGILALFVARWGVSIVLSMLPLAEVPDGLAFQVDARVLAFVAAISLVGVLLFGLIPAWRATQVDLTAALRSSQGASAAKGARRLARALVACQVALSVLLLVGAGLFVHTLRNLVRVDMGFNAERLLQVSLDTRGSGYGRGQVGPLYRLLVERVSAIPGVQSAAAIRNPVMRGLSRCRITITGLTLDPDESWDCADVGPSFFETMSIPVLRGRTFTDADFQQARGFVVISEAFARRYFPNEDPVGRFPIIGVVGNARLGAVRGESKPMTYHMLPAEPDRVSGLEVRTTGNPDGVAQAIQEQIRGINPRLLVGVNTVRREIDQTLAKERMVAALSAFFGLLGLLLASIGLFGVASSTVAQRTNELGIRMALGAGRWPVVRESLRETVLVFVAGMGAGILAALAAVRMTAGFISELLFGLTPADVANIAGAAILMVVVAVAACILPSYRATRIDPLAAIRHE